MATVRLKFRASSLPETEGTLYYQVIHKRNVKWISTGYHIYADEWNEEIASIVVTENSDRKTDLARMQCRVNWKMKQWRDVIDELANSHKSFSIEELCDAFKSCATDTTVFMYLQEQVTKKEQMKRQGTAMTYANAYRRFKEFREDKDLSFEELTPEMIECYEAWLIDRRLKQNSISCYMRTLSTLLHKAVDDGFTIDDKLFSRVRLTYVKTTKRAISEKELKVIARLRLPKGTTLAFARDIFMFSFYMRGMPFVDIAYLRKSDLRNGLMTYCRKKTNQCLTVEWVKELQSIVERYADETTDSPYLLPIIQEEDGTERKQCHRMLENINYSLKKIGAMAGLKIPLTTYVARHTWASVARDIDVPITVISEGMGHHSIKTTQVYLSSIDVSKINDANKKIIRRISRI